MLSMLSVWLHIGHRNWRGGVGQWSGLPKAKINYSSLWKQVGSVAKVIGLGYQDTGISWFKDGVKAHPQKAWKQTQEDEAAALADSRERSKAREQKWLSWGNVSMQGGSVGTGTIVYSNTHEGE